MTDMYEVDWYFFKPLIENENLFREMIRVIKKSNPNFFKQILLN